MSSNNSASGKTPLLLPQIAPASPKITLTRSTSPPAPLRVTSRAATPISSSSPPSSSTSPLLHSSSSSSCSSSSSPLVQRRPVHILSSPPAGLLHVPQVTRSQPSSPTNTPRCNIPIKSSPSSSPTSINQSNACNKDSPSSPSPNQMERISPSLEVWSEKWPAEGQSLRLSPTPSSERKVRSISISNSTPERGPTPERGSTPERCSTPELGHDNGDHGDVRTLDSTPLNHDTAGAKLDSTIATRPSHNANVKAVPLSSSSSSSSSSTASWSKDRKRPSSTVEVVKGSRPGGQIKRRYQDPVLLQARLRLTKTGKGPDLSTRLLGRGGHEGGEDQAAKRTARDNVSVEREQLQTLLAAASTHSSTPPPSMRSRTHSMSTVSPRAAGGTTTPVTANRNTLRQPRSVPVSPSTECRNNKGDPTSNMGQLREARSSCLPCRTPRLQRRGLGTEPSSHRGTVSPNTNNATMPPAETFTASPGSSTLKSDRKEMEQGRWGVMAPTRGNVTISPAETAQPAEAFMGPPPEGSPLKSHRSSSQEEEKEEEEESGGAQLGRFSPAAAAARQIKERETRADSGPTLTHTCQAPTHPYSETSGGSLLDSSTPQPLSRAALSSISQAGRRERRGEGRRGFDCTSSCLHQDTPTCSDTLSEHTHSPSLCKAPIQPFSEASTSACASAPKPLSTVARSPLSQAGSRSGEGRSGFVLDSSRLPQNTPTCSDTLPKPSPSICCSKGDGDNGGSVHRYEKKEGTQFPKGTPFSQSSPDHCALAAEAVTVCEVVRVVGATLVKRGRADSCRSPPPPQRPLPANPSPSPSQNISTLAKTEGEGVGLTPDRPRVSTLGAGEAHREGNARECTGNVRRELQLMSAHCQHSCQHPQPTPHPQKHQPNHFQYQPQYQQHNLHHHHYQQQYSQHQQLLQHNIQPDHPNHHHQQHQDQGLPPRPRNRPLTRQAAQLGLGLELGLGQEGSDGCRDSYSHRQRVLDTGMDWCPMDRLEEEEDPPLPEPSVCLDRMRAPLRQQGPGMGSGVWVTLDMADVVPPEVKPKPVVPAKPPHVAPPPIPSSQPPPPYVPPPLSASSGPPGNKRASSGGSALLGYIGIDTIIEQMRKKTMKTGFDFNMMVVGQSGLGKSTLVNTLFKSQVSRKSSDWGRDEKIPKTVEIKSVSHVIEEGGVKMKLTITDTPGFGDQINNDKCWEPISQFVNEQYEKYLKEEVNISRNKRIPDTRVHCCLYFIAPTGHSLRPLDIEFMKHLSHSVNLIPVIAKSDTLTPEEKSEFKQRVRKELEAGGIEFYPQKEFDYDVEDKADNDKIREVMPFAVVGSDKEYQVNGKRVLGRKTAWGIVEVENLTHCEFSLLRDFIIRSHLQDLKEVTHNIHYETFRAKRLNSNGGLHPVSSGTDTQESNL